MGFLSGKRALVVGLASERSIAYGIASAMHREGAELAFTYQGERLSERVAMVFSADGFPTPENRGMMANVVFVLTSAGVVVLDSGASVQIGEMAIRRLRTLTDRPVVAIVNSHYHGDHFLGNDAFVQAYGPQLPIYAHPEARRQIEGVAGNGWRAASRG